MDILVFKSLLPEVFLCFSILLQLIFNIKIVNNIQYNFPIIDREAFFQTVFIISSLIIIFLNLKMEGFFTNLLFLNDESTRLIKIIMLLSVLFSLNIIYLSIKVQSLNFFEYFVILLLAILAMCLLISSSDLISFYLVIEMQSLCFYILSSFKRNSSFSTEAGLKYFISGAFISGFFLFGSSLIYGMLGTLSFQNLNLLLAFPLESYGFEFNLLVLIGVLFVTGSLLFKIACVPFHFWAPDVYEGSPLSSTIVFSIIPKIPLVYFLIKWICALNIFFFNFDFILLICGLLSTIVGTLFALSQNRLKRLIIYSSIAQIGFVVAALSINSIGGFRSVLFFLIIYVITSILIWSHFSLFYYFQHKMNLFNGKSSLTPLYISSLSNLATRNKVWAVSMVIIFFSIGGIPPFVGFLAKVAVLFELILEFKIIAATILIFVSSVSIYYYIRIIKVVFFEPKDNNKNYEKSQIVFYNSDLDVIYFWIVLFLFSLYALFENSSFLYSFCEYIILNITVL